MEFRTELSFQSPTPLNLDYNSKIFTIGSCFATEISSRLSERKFYVNHNPFGVLFQPFAIENAIMRIYSNQEYLSNEVFKYEDMYLSWDHHSSFNEVSADKLLQKINKNIRESHKFLSQVDAVIITLGSSFVYKLNRFELVVANCHKIPGSEFTKYLLPEHQIKTSLKNIVEMLSDFGKDNLKIIFTLSPVRHIKDGLVENNFSKARLLNAIHSVIENYENCEYFPVYEFMMDDLRDYRFYKADLIHPNEIAIDYIWEKFLENYINPEVFPLMKKIEKLNSSIHHKPQHPNSIAYKKFLYNLLKEIQTIETELPHESFQQELLELKNKIQNAY